MEHGIIKKYYENEHYGFIENQNDEEIFFHKNELHPKFKNRRIFEGLRVKYDVKGDMKGDKAINIHIE